MLLATHEKMASNFSLSPFLFLVRAAASEPGFKHNFPDKEISSFIKFSSDPELIWDETVPKKQMKLNAIIYLGKKLIATM